jgi:hypothetical protein
VRKEERRKKERRKRKKETCSEQVLFIDLLLRRKAMNGPPIVFFLLFFLIQPTKTNKYYISNAKLSRLREFLPGIAGQTARGKLPGCLTWTKRRSFRRSLPLEYWIFPWPTCFILLSQKKNKNKNNLFYD